MFGDILFATIPFGTFDEDKEPAAYSIAWVNLCPAESEWENIEPEPLSTSQCTKRTA